MNRADLQLLSDLRRREARALLNARQYPGAYYLVGYAVECALKACVAKQVRRYDFPDKELMQKAYTHKLEQLMRLSGLASELDSDMQSHRALELHWAVVKDWSESARYKVAISAAEALDLYSACTARTHGILSWVRRRW